MSGQVAQGGQISAALTIAAGMAGLFLLLGFWPNNTWWGFNHLAFFPYGVRIIFGFLCIGALTPVVGRWVHRAVDGLSNLPGFLKGSLLLIIPAAAFVIFRIEVYSMGDGYLRAIEINRGEWYYPTEVLDYLVHAALYHAVKYVRDIYPTTAMAVTSIAAGVVFVVMLARQTWYTGPKKFLFMTAVLSLGGSQLFFGYAESYTLVYVCMIWYFLLAFRPGHHPVDFRLLTLAYLLAGLLHQIGLMLLISYLYFAFIRFREHPRRFAIFPVVLFIAALPLIVPHALKPFLEEAGVRSAGNYFLPLVDDTYGILSLSHGYDIINEVLIAAPLLIILLPFVPMIFRHGSRRILTLTLIVPALIFLCVFDPKLTMIRDWDLFALPLTMIAVPIIIMVFEAVKDDNIAMRLTGVILVSAVFTGAWILMNNYTPGHIQRAEFFLERAEWSKGWGYEMLGVYYHKKGDYANELRMLRKVPKNERSIRYYGKLGTALWEQGTDIAFFRTAVKTEPFKHEAWCKLGEALIFADSLDEAVAAFEKARSLDTASALPWFGLARVSAAKQDLELAAEYFQQGIARDPAAADSLNFQSLIGDSL